MQALDGASSTSTVPSILVRLNKDEFLGGKAEKIAIASGLFSSKSAFLASRISLTLNKLTDMIAIV